MPAVHDLLEALPAAGITIEARNGSLRYRPASAMTPDLLAAVKSYKAELLKALKSPGGPGAGSNTSDEVITAPARTTPIQDSIPQSRCDAEFARFERIARPMPGGGWYCPVFGSAVMPEGIPGEQWDQFVRDFAHLDKRGES